MPRFFKSPAVQYLGLFALLAIALFSALATPWAERLFVQPFTQLLVDICALVLKPFDSRVMAQGDILRFPTGMARCKYWRAAMRSRSAPC